MRQLSADGLKRLDAQDLRPARGQDLLHAARTSERRSGSGVLARRRAIRLGRQRRAGYGVAHQFRPAAAVSTATAAN